MDAARPFGKFSDWKREEKMAAERRIDVNQSNHSVIDSEFDSMRDRFEKEMRRVDEEMQV